MLRLLPYLVAFVAGCVAGAVLLHRASPGGSASEWEKKYREMLQRYRDLTRRLEDLDGAAERKASRLRKTLTGVAEALRRQDPAGESTRAALLEIDAALKED